MLLVSLGVGSLSSHAAREREPAAARRHLVTIHDLMGHYQLCRFYEARYGSNSDPLRTAVNDDIWNSWARGDSIDTDDSICYDPDCPFLDRLQSNPARIINPRDMCRKAHQRYKALCEARYDSGVPVMFVYMERACGERQWKPTELDDRGLRKRELYPCACPLLGQPVHYVTRGTYKDHELIWALYDDWWKSQSTLIGAKHKFGSWEVGLMLRIVDEE